MKSIIAIFSLLFSASTFAADAPKAAATTPAASAPAAPAKAVQPAKGDKKAETKPEAKK